jgi:hypothetical protein
MANCEGISEVKTDAKRMTLRSMTNARVLQAKVDHATTALKKLPDEKDYRLSFLDPYFIAAVSDLLALNFGHAEKAAFLMQVKAMYPKEITFIQPGIISVYYYLSDSKLKDESPWPLEETLEELRFAMAGADHMIRSSREIPSDRYKLAVKCDEPKKEKNCFDEIIKVYFNNKFIILNRFLEIYDKHFLSGGILSEQHRYEWARSYKQLEAVLNLQRFGPSVNLDRVAGSPLAERDRAAWAKVDVRSEYEFDARVAMALSSVMLTEGPSRNSTPQACTAASFYLKEAREKIPSLSDKKPDQDSRLHGYVAQIESRVRASCSDRR